MRDIFLQLSKMLQQETAWSWYCNTRDRVWGKLTSEQPYRVTWMTVCRCEGEGKGTGYTRLQQCDLWKLWGLGRTATITKFQNFDATSCYCKIGWNCLWISIFISTQYFCSFWISYLEYRVDQQWCPGRCHLETPGDPLRIFWLNNW